MSVKSNKRQPEEKVYGHYFLDFSIENVRCYGKKQTVKLSDEKGRPYQWTIILGDNGVGKTAILKGIVSLAPSPGIVFGGKHKTRLFPGYLDWQQHWDPRRSEGESVSVLAANTIGAYSLKKLLDDKILPLEVEIHHHAPTVKRSKSLAQVATYTPDYSELSEFLCLGYGESRRIGRGPLTQETYATASASLFDDESSSLINVEAFFLQSDSKAKSGKAAVASGHAEKIKRLLVDLLPEVSDLRISKESRAGRRVEVKTPYGWIPINEISLGYKSLISWVVDFAGRMIRYHQDKEQPFLEPAVVLIEEIDLHLHPNMQRKLLRSLSARFPNTQFIATAHSPLIVQAALEANLVLLKRKGAQVIVENNVPLMNNWRVDQILTSELFGLSSARSEKAEKLMTERRKLILKPEPSQADKKKLDNLEQQLDFVPVTETPEYIQAMKIIHESSKKLE